jgi:hypothetical protein
MLSNSHRIPLETAHRFLATFGITEPTKEYERWVKNDGFDFEDFPAVLSDSPFIFLIDWRAALEDELALIVPALARLDAVLECQIDPETSRGAVTCDGQTRQVKYVPNDNDDFTAVIVALQSIVPPSVEFRASPLNGEMDQWNFAVLPSDEWAELEALDPELVSSLFLPLPHERA